jgi:hypothetical protein
MMAVALERPTLDVILDRQLNATSTRIRRFGPVNVGECGSLQVIVRIKIART